MKKILLTLIISIVVFSGLSSAQSDISEKLSLAMEYYHNAHYADAGRLFDELVKKYSLDEEQYAVVRFYEADVALKMGETSSSVSGFEYIVNNINWSKFREEALFNLGLIYFEEGEYTKSRERLVRL